MSKNFYIFPMSTRIKKNALSICFIDNESIALFFKFSVQNSLRLHIYKSFIIVYSSFSRYFLFLLLAPSLIL